VDIILDGLRLLPEKNWQAVILGSGDPDLEKTARKLASDYAHCARVMMKFDSTLSHQLYAAGDIFMMPSRYEPCGLSQMIAMRYGCLPVARNTGGLHDTIIPTTKTKRGTGFLFSKPQPSAFMEKLVSAINMFNKKSIWTKMQKKGMQQDFSWTNSALAYYKEYSKLID